MGETPIAPPDEVRAVEDFKTLALQTKHPNGWRDTLTALEIPFDHPDPILEAIRAIARQHSAEPLEDQELELADTYDDLWKQSKLDPADSEFDHKALLEFHLRKEGLLPEPPAQPAVAPVPTFAEATAGGQEPPATPATPLTREQQLEARRQEIVRNLAIISVNMAELDGYKMVDPSWPKADPLPSVDLYTSLRDQMSRLGPQVTIYDGGTLANAREATNQLLNEINRRRAARGEPPAETVFDQQQAASEATPLASSIESADMVQFSTNLANAISDLPHVLPSPIDKTNPMWGRVNALRRGDVTFGQANESTMVFDQTRQRIATKRYLYQGGRYAGRWEQEIEYNRDIAKGENLPKTLGHYRESLFGEDRKSIEEVRVEFNRSGRVYAVENVHYTDGVQTGMTRLEFNYDSDGHIIETTEIELDASGQNELRRKTKPYIAKVPAAEPAPVAADAGLAPSAAVIKLREQMTRPLGESLGRVVVGTATESARRHPYQNEDSFFAERTPAGAVFAGIFDGVSLSKYGDGGKASRQARDFVASRLTSYRIQDLDAVLEEVDQEIRARRKIGADLGETTATVVEIYESRVGFEVRFASAGDSRVYVFDSATKKLRQLSQDHSSVVDSVDEDDVPKPGQELFYRENRNKIWNGIGGDNFARMELSTGGASISSGDIVLLTTDGIHDNLTRPEIEKIIQESIDKQDTPDMIPKLLVKAARAVSNLDRAVNSRAKDDDMTALVVEVKRRTGAYFIRPEINKHWFADLSSGATARYREMLREKGQTIRPVGSGIWLLADGIAYR
ncbi:MAG: SpoIIE family protein phosphatase, partial [Candidatus Blackburnbacteria bacterium]|nr:SpoIIE family protein phosphatase [Candidatus Blackburnbacteria bacterium]